MIQREYNAQTGKWTEIEISDPEPIFDSDFPEPQEVQTPEERIAALEEQLVVTKILLGLE